MNITISGRHFDITSAIRTHAEGKASKLSKYYDHIHSIEVILEAAGLTKRVEMIVNVERSNRLVAHADSNDLYGCIDLVIHKLERQLTDHKERSRNHKHPTP